MKEEVELYIMRDGDKWKVDDAQLEALLSLVSYSAWAHEQKKRGREEKQKRENTEHLKSPGHRTEKQNVENSKSIGWLRAKALDSQVYDKVVGSSKLSSDLIRWIPATEKVFKEVRIVDELREDGVLAVSTGSSFDSEGKPPTLGFYMNDETSGSSGMITIQLLIWRALTCPDTFLSNFIERRAFILHLFSAFIWAITEYVSAEDFHPTTVICFREVYTAVGVELFPVLDSDYWLPSRQHPQLKSDKIETFVQKLQSTGLGTSKEIYEVLIPPLSHFNKLPNEALADWCNEGLIRQELSLRWENTFGGYMELLKAVQHRKVQDRFANRAAAIIIGFLLRINQDLEPFTLDGVETSLITFNKNVRELVENKNQTVLKAILSLEPILARQRKLPKNGSILTQLGVQDLKLVPLAHDFTFPNATDVFGWTEGYWSIFDGIQRDENSYKTLDLAGQSVLHHAIDRYGGLESLIEDGVGFAQVLSGYKTHKLLEDSGLLTARYNKQTPLHRAARTGNRRLVEILLKGYTDLYADLNAADFYRRTALCLAAQYGKSEVVDVLCEKMSQDGLNRMDNYERNALHYVVLNHKEDAALNLIEHKINYTGRDRKDRTALWYAAQEGMEKVVKSLLEADKINVHDVGQRSEEKNGKLWSTPEQEAEWAGHTKIAKMIRERKTK